MPAIRQSYRQRMWNAELDARDRRRERVEAKPVLTLTISVSRSVGLPGYNNKVESFVCVAGITKDTTPEEFMELMDTQKANWATMTKALNEKVMADVNALGGPAKLDVRS